MPSMRCWVERKVPAVFVCCGLGRIAPGSKLRFNSTQPFEQWLIAAEFDPEEELLISREWKRQEGDRYLQSLPSERQHGEPSAVA